MKPSPRASSKDHDDTGAFICVGDFFLSKILPPSRHISQEDQATETKSFRLKFVFKTKLV